MSQQKPFKTLPDHDDVQVAQRDLQFYPCTTEHPQILTAEQIEAFNQDGYLKGLCVSNHQEMTENRRYFDELLKRVLAEGGNSYSISTAHLQYGGVYDLLKHPKIVAYVRDLLGENVIGWGSHFFCKLPGDGKIAPWHQDASYWPLTPSKTVTAWLAIDDADTENACMRFIRGSHKYGHLTYKRIDLAKTAVLDQEVEDAEKYGDPVDVQLKAGEISLHADLLLHGSKANDSDRRRCGLTLRYCATEVRASMGWNDKGVVVSGEDPSGHWKNPPRPDV